MLLLAVWDSLQIFGIDLQSCDGSCMLATDGWGQSPPKEKGNEMTREKECWDCGRELPKSEMAYRYRHEENELGFDEEDSFYGKVFYRCKSCDGQA